MNTYLIFQWIATLGYITDILKTSIEFVDHPLYTTPHMRHRILVPIHVHFGILCVELAPIKFGFDPLRIGTTCLIGIGDWVSNHGLPRITQALIILVFHMWHQLRYLGLPFFSPVPVLEVAMGSTSSSYSSPPYSSSSSSSWYWVSTPSLMIFHSWGRRYSPMHTITNRRSWYADKNKPTIVLCT